MTVLCKVLTNPHCKMQILRLRCCNLSSKACEKLASCVPGNQILRELHLDHNDIGEVGLTRLCQALRHPNCKLQVLSLYNCNLTTSGCLNLASVLCTNQTLKELALGHNEDLGVAGVQFLCQGLLCPSSKIHTLRLDFCGLTEACWEDLCVALKINQALCHLDLSDNEALKMYLKADKWRKLRELKQHNHRTQIQL